MNDHIMLTFLFSIYTSPNFEDSGIESPASSQQSIGSICASKTPKGDRRGVYGSLAVPSISDQIGLGQAEVNHEVKQRSHVQATDHTTKEKLRRFFKNIFCIYAFHVILYKRSLFWSICMSYQAYYSWVHRKIALRSCCYPI